MRAGHSVCFINIHYIGPSRNCGKRHRTCNAFSKSRKIRNNIVMLEGEHLSASAKTGLYFIADQENLICRTEFSEQFHKTFWRKCSAAALEAFKNNTGNFVFRFRSYLFI